MRAILVAGGTIPSKKLLTQEITKNCIIIAVDGGANCLWQYKIIPHYIIGDFDSIDPSILKLMSDKKAIIESYPSVKDLTDAELALNKALKLKAKEIVILGCLGGKRVDHLIGAIGLLDKCLKSNIKSCLKDDYQIVTLLQKSITIFGNIGDVFSLQAYGSGVKHLNIKGGKYPLNDYFLKMGDALTLSNEFQNKKVSIQFSSGKLLLIIQINKEAI